MSILIARQTDLFMRFTSCHEIQCLIGDTIAPADLLLPASLVVILIDIFIFYFNLCEVWAPMSLSYIYEICLIRK